MLYFCLELEESKLEKNELDSSKNDNHKLIIRNLSTDSLDDAVGIHKTTYPVDHLTSQLPHTLLKSYYLDVIKTSLFSLGAYSEKKLVGFVIATDSESSVSPIKLLLKARFWLWLFSDKELFFRAMIAGKSFLASNFISPDKQKNNVRYRLFSIAVSQSHLSHGVGYKLITELENCLYKSGISHYGLTVKKGNDRAIRFYEKNGFIVESSSSSKLSLVKNLK